MAFGLWIVTSLARASVLGVFSLSVVARTALARGASENVTWLDIVGMVIGVAWFCIAIYQAFAFLAYGIGPK